MDENESMDFNAYKKHMNDYLNRFYVPDYFPNAHKSANENLRKNMEGLGYKYLENEGGFEDKDGNWLPSTGNDKAWKQHQKELGDVLTKGAKTAKDEHMRIKNKFSRNFLEGLPERYHKNGNIDDYLPTMMFQDWYDSDSRLQDELDKQKSITEGVKERW